MTIDSLLRCTRFRNGLDESSALNPLQTAFCITIANILLLFFYIYFSGRLAEEISTSTESLALIEIVKGFAFACISGLVLFFATYSAFKKVSAQDTIIIKKNKSIIETERLVMAGIFSASVCHDINNIMSIVQVNLEFFRGNRTIWTKRNMNMCRKLQRHRTG